MPEFEPSRDKSFCEHGNFSKSCSKCKATTVLGIKREDLSGDVQRERGKRNVRYEVEGKLVEVSGTVDNIGKDILDKPYISLKTGEIIGSVQCMLDDDAIAEASALAEGTKVTMQGRVNGLLGNVLVKDCTLVTK